MTTERLHFSTGMLRRLGEELNPHADQGILELVRNAYDADASECVVELINTQKPGGTIRVSDDGVGMTATGIRQGWLVLGTSEKASVRQTSRNRFPIGNKGIGRLAALRMGRAATLTTRPETEPMLEHRLAIDWDDFDTARLVDEVSLEIVSSQRAGGVRDGTIVEISDLRTPMIGPDVKRLARAMVLLADPFRDSGTAGHETFRPVLHAQEFQDLERLVARGYRDEADYYLRAELDKDGRASASVMAYPGEELFRANHENLSSAKGHPIYTAPSAVFELWWFVLQPANFSPRSVTLAEVREWLAEFGGVHLYHRGMRVSPDNESDWLDMNLRRVRSPELRPSTNNSIGRISVLDESGQLKPKTDRDGFVEEGAFQDLKRFATDALKWFADEMLKRREKQRGSQKERAAKNLSRAQENLQQVIDEVAPASKEKVQKAIKEYERAKDQETNTLREDLQLYRTLGTAGATTAAFAHQSKSPLVQIASSAGTLEEAVVERDLFQLQTLAALAGGIRRNSESLLAFAKVTLGLLQHEKRRRGTVSVHASVGEIVALLQPYIVLREAEVRQELTAEVDAVLASRAAIESILTNLIINSLKAFEKREPGERLIIIRTCNVIESGGKNRPFIQLTVLDNGPGITGLSVEDVWLPGKTTTEDGTGLGLTIVKDVAIELGGRVCAVACGEMGGAEIMVQLPVRGGG